jgi:hypothetical protein
VTPDHERLSDDPVRLSRRRARDERSEQDQSDGFRGREEVLDARPALEWRPSRRLVVAVVVVVMVATTGWYADRQERTREVRALEGCRRQLHDAVVFADLRLMAMADYLAPALSMTSGTRRARLMDDMEVAARSALGDVERADRGCRAVSIRPWHFALASQHRAETAYSGALAARMRGVADRGSSYYRDNTSLQRIRDQADIHILGGPF